MPLGGIGRDMRFVRAILSGVTLTATGAAAPALPVPDVSFEVTAPSPHGPWTMRIVNEDSRPVRIPADVRLLRFSITPPGAKRPIACDIPPPLRPTVFPAKRALHLAPGEAFVERLDPRLFCFGAREAGALVEGAAVRAFFGWSRRGPFAVQGLDWPPELASLHELAAPEITIGSGATRAPSAALGAGIGEAPPEEDEEAPRLALSAPRFVQARTPRGVVLRYVARNVGHRSMRVVLRARMLSFDIDGPDGPIRCAVDHRPRAAAPPDVFRTLAPGASIPISVRLDEACDYDALHRPGLYRITAALHADETGEAHGIPAYTGLAVAPRATLVRLLSADKPFYVTAPEATTVR